MTTKTLSGTYTAGYTLSATYTTLIIGPPGSVTGIAGTAGTAGGPGAAGGVGIQFNFAAALVDHGAVVGGAGGAGANVNGGFGGAGGDGGVAAMFVTAGMVNNIGTVTGGSGGSGGYGDSFSLPAGGGAGGTGGAALQFAGSGHVINSGALQGGSGGAAGLGGKIGMGGSGGGAGIVLMGGGGVTNSGDVLGGAGGAGSEGYSYAGAGGSGGLGVYAALFANLSNSGVISGGQGADGGYSSGGGGAGGGGGWGAVFHSGGVFGDSGSISGGIGGAGGSRAGNGGAAGGGLELGGVSNLVNTQGTITGGQGGDGGYAFARSGDGGSGGVGLEISDVATVDGGTVSGGGGGGGGGHLGAFAGVGGTGGAGARVVDGGNLTIDARVTGGVGGVGGTSGRYAGGVGGAGGAGAILVAGGGIFNTGEIIGGHGGAGGRGAKSGSTGTGVVLAAGGVLTNGVLGATSALIEGSVGVYAGPTGAATVTNFGSIGGLSGISVQFMLAADRLIVESGASFTGAAQGGGGALELAAATATISGLGATARLSGADVLTFGGFATYQLDIGGDWTLAGNNTIASSQTLVLSGDIISKGTLTSLTGSSIELNNGDIHGGGLVTTGTAKVNVLGGLSTLDGTNSAVLNKAQVVVFNGASLAIVGTIAGTGRITLAGSSREASLIVASGGATLSGGGWVDLAGNGNDLIAAASAGATLTNVNDRIFGAGRIGGGQLALINQAGGVILGEAAAGLTIDTGAFTIANSGLIEADTQALTIESAVANTGKLYALRGTLTLVGAVTGAGRVFINAGTLEAQGAFSEVVEFLGGKGVLSLAQSQAYSSDIYGFSTAGRTSLDLGDISFVTSDEPTFSGSTKGGVLTVSDGARTARITLIGDYTASTFVASSDGHGGTIVIDPAAGSPILALVTAMAAMPADRASIHATSAFGADAPGPGVGSPGALLVARCEGQSAGARISHHSAA